MKAIKIIKLLEKLDPEVESFVEFIEENIDVKRVKYNTEEPEPEVGAPGNITDIEIVDYILEFKNFKDYLGFDIKDERFDPFIKKVAKEISKNKGKYAITILIDEYSEKVEFKENVKFPLFKIIPKLNKKEKFEIDFDYGWIV